MLGLGTFVERKKTLSSVAQITEKSPQWAGVTASLAKLVLVSMAVSLPSLSFLLCSNSPLELSFSPGCPLSGMLNSLLSFTSGDPQPFVPAFFITARLFTLYLLSWELLEDRDSFVNLLLGLSLKPRKQRYQEMYSVNYTEGGWASVDHGSEGICEWNLTQLDFGESCCL